MPSLRHSSATLSSPRKPAITMRTFSSAEYNRRVARLISRTAFSASSECVSAFDLISAPFALKMSQKPSLPQSLQTVQLVLTGNSMHHLVYQAEKFSRLLDGQTHDFHEDGRRIEPREVGDQVASSHLPEGLDKLNAALPDSRC